MRLLNEFFIFTLSALGTQDFPSSYPFGFFKKESHRKGAKGAKKEFFHHSHREHREIFFFLWREAPPKKTQSVASQKSGFQGAAGRQLSKIGLSRFLKT
ncbi:MAG: hypothetical protein AB1585_19820 [Thermodesulfobacteriota bacterium]